MTEYYNIENRKKDEYDCYLRWAYHEAFTYIFAQSGISELDAAEKFLKLTERGIKEGKTEAARFIFQVAFDATETIIDDLILKNERNVMLF